MTISYTRTATFFCTELIGHICQICSVKVSPVTLARVRWVECVGARIL